jgi:hypothetical protein
VHHHPRTYLHGGSGSGGVPGIGPSSGLGNGNHRSPVRSDASSCRPEPGKYLGGIST